MIFVEYIRFVDKLFTSKDCNFNDFLVIDVKKKGRKAYHFNPVLSLFAATMTPVNDRAITIAAI